MKIPSLSSRSHTQGFTLIEMLVVVAIVVTLVTLTLGIMGWSETKKQEESARIAVNQLSMALEQYKSETGNLPEDSKDGALSSNALYVALFSDPDSLGRPEEGAKVYYPDLDPNLGKGAGKGKAKFVQKQKGIYVIIDPWGQPYRYRRGFNEGNREGKNPDFDIWSFGKDGRDNTGDELSNFK